MNPSGHASPSAIYAVIFTFTALATLAVALRIYTRRVILRKLEQDDVLMFVALLCACCFTVCQALETYYGLGHRLVELSEFQQTESLRWLWISIIFYHIGLPAAKLSIISQCIQVFGSIRTFKISARIVATVVLVYTVFTILITIFLCWPVDFFWQRNQPGRCLPRVPIWFFNSAFGAATDVAVAILPLPVVNRLIVPKRQRYLLMVVFALGGAVCIVTVIRFYSLYAVTTSDDYTWENPQAALYSNIELSVSIIGGCLPTYNAFVAKYFPRLYNAYAGPRGDPFGDIKLSFPQQSQKSVSSCVETMSTVESGKTALDSGCQGSYPDSKTMTTTLSDVPTVSTIRAS